MKRQALNHALNGIALPADRREAVRQRIFAELNAEAPAPRTRIAHPKRRLRHLAGVAALVLALGMLFAIPGVSRAVTDWLGRLFDTNAYLSTPQEQRAPHPDVAEAIHSPEAETQSHEIRLLHETPEYGQLNRLRTEAGFAAYAPADWEWLRLAVPEVREALLSGGTLYVTTFLATDPAPFFAPSGSARRLDWYADGVTADLGTGEQIALPLIGTGTRRQTHWFGADGTLDVEAVRADGGVLLMSEYDASGVVLDGSCTMTQTTRILDRSIDEQGVLATVAIIEQTFPLDIAQGSAPAGEAGGAVRLMGTYPLTVEAGGSERTVYNWTVDLSEVSVVPRAMPHTTGVTIELQFHFPAAWTPELRQALLGGLVHKWDGLRYALLVDGESVALLQPENDSRYGDGAVLLEIPLTKAQQAEAAHISLRPVLGYSTALIVDGTMASDLAAPYRFGVFSHYDTENASCPLKGCDIEVALGQDDR